MKTLEQLTQRYKELSSKSNLDYSEQKELIGIQHDLAAAYGVTAESIDGANDSAKEYLATLKLLHTQELKDLQAKQKEASQAAFVKANNAEVIEALKKQKKIKDEIAEIDSFDYEEYKANSTKEVADQEVTRLQKRRAELEDNLKNEEAILQRHKGLFAEWFKAAAEEGLTGAALAGEIINTALSDMLIDMFDIDLTKFGGDINVANKWVNDMVADFVEAASGADTSAALTAVTEVVDKIKQGITPSEEDITTFSEGWAKLIGGESPLIEFIKQLVKITGEDLATVTNQFLAMLLGLEDVNDVMMLLKNGGEQLGGTLKGMAASFTDSKVSAEQLKAETDRLTTSFEQLQKKSDNLRNLKDVAKETKDLVSQFKKAQAEGKDTGQILKNIGTNADKLGLGFDGTAESVADFEGALAEAEAGIDGSLTAVASELQTIIADAEAARDALYIDGVITADEADALAAINAVLIPAKLLLAIFQALGLAGSAEKSGGGGGKKEDPEEEARKAAEKARQEALCKAYELLEHKKHLNQLTLEDELRMLEEIREKHRLNAEEIMDWEEKVYDVKKALRERDASSVDKMGDAIIDALAARYEAMLEAEVERLDASRKAWEEWRDGSVKAIQDQINALDELAETEDREKKDQEELRKIAKLRQDIEFEQDDYNRMKLQQQLDQAISSRDDRLHRQDIQDQKDALQKQIESIEEEADAQLKALDEEQDSIERAYAERMKSAALRAEAEKLIMTGTQQEIIGLIGEFAPDYDALGKTLGEKLLDGFKNKVGNVVDWFKRLNDSLYTIQEDAAAQAVSAADSFYAGQQRRQQQSASGNTPPPTVVNQTVNFN